MVKVLEDGGDDNEDGDESLAFFRRDATRGVFGLVALLLAVVEGVAVRDFRFCFVAVTVVVVVAVVIVVAAVGGRMEG